MAADRSWSRGELDVGGQVCRYHRLAAVEEQGLGSISRLPRSIRILLENLLRHEDGVAVTRDDIAALASWRADGSNTREIAFRPARVLLQDFTGVPAVVDLAAMRDAIADLGGDPDRINPLRPADLVVDHSVQVDHFGSPDAERLNTEIEFSRNRERYEFLRWGQSAFEGLSVVPPGTGIVHQVNLEYLARVVFLEQDDEGAIAFPDSLVGTDSHTTMVNGLGVLGWGVGGIEAEASLLGQPVSMLIPDVVGFKMTGRLPEGATATDLVLTVTQMLRAHGVVGKFVEFLGDGLAALSLADRATVANMAPEYGATMGFFPVDEKSLDYLRFTARPDDQVELVEAYCRANGLFAGPDEPDPEYTSTLELDLSQVVPSIAGPRRPQDRVPLTESAGAFERELAELTSERDQRVAVGVGGDKFEIGHGSVVIAAITSCTNTSNPAVMLAAGLVARKAVARGLAPRPWVKTSLAPGSKVVHDYLEAAGLMEPLAQLGFDVVGYGCTTCIGNSGPVAEPIEQAIQDGELVAVSVLSGNRNFEGRVNRAVRANYLASPPLVVAYALAGRMDIDLYTDPLGEDRDGTPVYLRDVWPTTAEVEHEVSRFVDRGMFERRYASVFDGTDEWRAIPVAEGRRYAWSDSTYILKPPFFDGLTLDVPPLRDIEGARVLALLGDSVTTDHISPAGLFPADGPAGQYLIEHGVAPADFNSFGSRRGNHEVMLRGTFANIRLRNRLAPGTEGGFTRYMSDGNGDGRGGEVTTIFEAAERYREAGVPLIVIAGKEYGTGSSRDWAAKG
ncbi:MAG: aconitate hydratase AcnA, partial [Deltaproteobacteria bacterium]|nr:aconitate hydratase AcnA [Deltaproteobacteria bacterium]